MNRTAGVAPKPSVANDVEKGLESPNADGPKDDLPSPGASETQDEERSKYVGSPVATDRGKIDGGRSLSPALPIVKPDAGA